MDKMVPLEKQSKEYEVLRLELEEKKVCFRNTEVYVSISGRYQICVDVEGLLITRLFMWWNMEHITYECNNLFF